MTTLLAAAPNESRGAQRPRLSLVPPCVSSTGDEAIELAYLAGLELDEWQQWCLRNALGERPDGKWAAFGVGIVVPRQNGKGGLLEARELAGLFLLGERLIIHTAHEFPTSNEAFIRLAALVEDTPELSKRLARNGISRSHGSEGITLNTGQRILFKTRTSRAARGFTADCLILDEAMILPHAFVSNVLPTLAARPNPQVLYTGSAVDQRIHEHGLVLTGVRERAIAGDDPRLFYAEWSAEGDIDGLTEAAAMDLGAWAQANPALGIRITPEYIEAERREFNTNLRGFAVERLGVGDWPDTSGAPEEIIPAADWAECADEDSRRDPDAPLVVAFDVSPTRMGCIAIAAARLDGLIHVEVLEHRQGTSWMVQTLLALQAKEPAAVLCDSKGPAGSLIPELAQHDRDILITQLGPTEHAQACGLFYDAVTGDEKSLRHLNDPVLNAAVEGAAKRPLGEAWAWSRRDSSVDISPLVAVTLAHMSARALSGGVQVASFSEWQRRMGPDRISELQANAARKRQELIDRQRQRLT